MAHLFFSRTAKVLTLVPGDPAKKTLGFPAANFVDHRSKGEWPLGRFNFAWYQPPYGDGPESAYGSHGVLLFEVNGREGMGVHAGREGIPDGMGRSGYEHCTMGCIRTTDAAMAVLVAHPANDPIQMITVHN